MLSNSIATPKAQSPESLRRFSRPVTNRDSLQNQPVKTGTAFAEPNIASIHLDGYNLDAYKPWRQGFSN